MLEGVANTGETDKTQSVHINPNTARWVIFNNSTPIFFVNYFLMNVDRDCFLKQLLLLLVWSYICKKHISMWLVGCAEQLPYHGRWV